MDHTFTVTGTSTGGYVEDLLPAAVLAGSRQALGTRAEVEAEIDAILTAVRDFWRKQPDEVMREIAAYSARVTELEVHLHRIETTDRHYKQIRTLQTHPLLAELDRQFKIHSRMVELRRQDLETAKAFT